MSSAPTPPTSTHPPSTPPTHPPTGRRVRQARGLHDDGIKLFLALQQLVEDADQIPTHCGSGREHRQQQRRKAGGLSRMRSRAPRPAAAGAQAAAAKGGWWRGCGKGCQKASQPGGCRQRQLHACGQAGRQTCAAAVSCGLGGCILSTHALHAQHAAAAAIAALSGRHCQHKWCCCHPAPKPLCCGCCCNNTQPARKHATAATRESCGLLAGLGLTSAADTACTTAGRRAIGRAVSIALRSTAPPHCPQCAVPRTARQYFLRFRPIPFLRLTIVHFEDLLLRLHDQGIINAHLQRGLVVVSPCLEPSSSSSPTTSKSNRGSSGGGSRGGGGSSGRHAAQMLPKTASAVRPAHQTDTPDGHPPPQTHSQ